MVKSLVELHLLPREDCNCISDAEARGDFQVLQMMVEYVLDVNLGAIGISSESPLGGEESSTRSADR